MPKTPFTCGRNAKTEKKPSVFKNIRIRVDGVLNKLTVDPNEVKIRARLERDRKNIRSELFK